MERKFHSTVLLFPGAKRPGAKGPGNELARVRKGQGAKVPRSELARVLLADSLCCGSEWGWERKGSVPLFRYPIHSCTSHVMQLKSVNDKF